VQQTHSTSTMLMLPRCDISHRMRPEHIGHQWKQQHSIRQHQTAEYQTNQHLRSTRFQSMKESEPGIRKLTPVHHDLKQKQRRAACVSLPVQNDSLPLPQEPQTAAFCTCALTPNDTRFAIIVTITLRVMNAKCGVWRPSSLGE